jgi:hypothetical protein
MMKYTTPPLMLCLQAGDSPDPPGGVHFFVWIITVPVPPRRCETSLVVV